MRRVIVQVEVVTDLDDGLLVAYLEGALEVGMEPGGDYPLEDATELKSVKVWDGWSRSNDPTT